MAEVGLERRQSHDKSVNRKFETILVVQGFHKRRGHLVQNKTANEASEDANRVLCRFSFEADIFENAKYGLGKFKECLSSFRAVCRRSPKGCGRQTRPFQRVRPHGMRHYTQRVGAALAFYVAFNSS